MTTTQSSPFRKWYAHIGETRALLDSSVRFTVFTATASKSTKANILTILNMRPLSTYMIENSPLKSNLTFIVSYISNDLKLNHVFYSLIQELKNFGDKTEWTIVFCQTRNQCALIWRMLALELGQNFFKSRKVSPHHRLVEMFHAGSPKSVKEHVLLEIGKEDSFLCILICTIAFGMGIDCKGVHRVIHFGPSKTIESYLQECGRAGRDNQPSVCYLLYNGFLASRCSSEMKKFVQSSTCRKDSIAENVPVNHGQITKVCCCCDVCLSKCECKSPCDKKYAQFGKITTDMSTNIAKKSRVVSADQRRVLKSKLTAYDELHKRVTRNTVKPISYPSLLLEFGNFQIQQVINKCGNLFTLEDILDNIEIWRIVHANYILVALSETFNDINIDTAQLQLSDLDQEMEDELLDQWLDFRDDSQLDILADSFEIEEVTKSMDEHDQSGI